MLIESFCELRGCKWFLGIYSPNDTEMGQNYTCKAFPEGIPGDITIGDNFHSEPLDSQENEIIFEMETNKDID